MTPRERFLTAFEHIEGDRVPIFDVPNNPLLFRNILGEENYYSEGVPHVLLAKSLGLDACLVSERGYTGLIAKHWDWIAADRFTDELGVVYLCNESSWPLGIPQKTSIHSRSEWEKITLPDPREPWRHQEIRLASKEAHKGKGDDIAVVAGVRSAFSVMYISMGLEALSMNLYDDPSLILEMAETLTGFWTESAIASLESGADAVFIANDLGLNTGTIISPDDLRKFFFPSFFRQIERIKRAGGKIIFHSCGNINSVLGDLVEAGIDCYNNIQVSAGMDITDVKEQYGDRLALMGNVDATNIMPRATAAEIEAAVKKTLAAASPGGGHILATDHSFHKGIPPENVYAFLDAGKKWGKYR